MIGIFGIIETTPDVSTSVDGMVGRLDSRYQREVLEAPGAIIGRAYHETGSGGGSAVSADGNYQLVFSGEIFGHGDRNAASKHLLKILIANDGPALAAINGQFCAALYDKSKHRISIITDRLCTFPVHVWRSDNRVLFASHIHTLLGDARVPRKADPAAVAQLFTMQRTIGRITPLQSIDALPAATRTDLAPNFYQETPYWHLEWRAPSFSRKDGPRVLAAAFQRAMARQSSGDRVGIMLSGGLDSRLLLTAAPEPTGLHSWTTASYAENPELAIAKEIADMFGSEHHSVIVDPEETLIHTDPATIAADGMYPSSNGYYALAATASAGCSVALTGHGLDYTLRGYYLPAKFISVAGSNTRYPGLRPIPPRPTGQDVLENLRQGPPQSTIQRIVAAQFKSEWWDGQAQAMDTVLTPWLQSSDPYNAWDAFLLHAVSKHYAFTGMQAIRAFSDLRMPAFDNDVFDIYLQMPPSWRCQGRMTQQTLQILSPKAARIPNANTNFRCDLDPRLEVAALLGRGALRRLGVLKRAILPSAAHSEGSWQNLGALYRNAPGFRNRLLEVQNRLDALSCGCLDPDGLSTCIDEQLAGTRKHDKLIRQLLTHDAWARQYGII